MRESARRFGTVYRTVLFAMVLAAGILAAGVTVAVAGKTPATPRTTAAASEPASVPLPAPPGPYPVGTRPLQLVDHSRRDTLAPTAQNRTLMIQLWYPAAHANRYPIAPYMPTEAARYEDQTLKLPAGTFESVRSYGHLDAPPAPAPSGWPVVLFSPGLGTTRLLYTTLVEDLASRGYLVVAIDHPYDADVVEFPDGHLATMAQITSPRIPDLVQIRTQDTSFVLDQLNRLDAGSLVPGWSHRLDLTRIGMFGHSLGGASTAAVMFSDQRIAAGANLDGTFYGPYPPQGLDRPFLLMSSAMHDRTNDPSWAQMWPLLRGWRLDLKLAGSGHRTYSDIAVLASPLHLTKLFPPDQLPYIIGTIDGIRAATIEQTYLTAFFDQTLRHRTEPLLRHPDPHFPEILFDN